MKLFTPFARAKQAQTTTPHADIAQRLETPEGCHAYLSELQKSREDHRENREVFYLIGRQIDEVRRAASRLLLQARRQAATAAIAGSRNAAVNAVKAAEKALAVADGEHASAAQACEAMQARMAPLSAQVAELRQLAAQRVQAAQANFDAVMTQANTDEAAELKASQTLIEAQHALASSGAVEGLRLDKLAQQLEALKAAEQAAAQLHHEAVATLNQALAMPPLVELDSASLQLLNAYFLAIEANDHMFARVPSWTLPKAPSVWFTRSEHAVSYGGGDTLSPTMVSDMAQTLKPINFSILAEPLPVQVANPLPAGDSTPGDAESSDGSAPMQAQRQVLHRGIRRA